MLSQVFFVPMFYVLALLQINFVCFSMSYVLNSPMSTLALVSKAELWGFLRSSSRRSGPPECEPRTRQVKSFRKAPVRRAEILRSSQWQVPVVR